jgi:hypothetical protein
MCIKEVNTYLVCYTLAPLYCRLLASPKNIRLGWKGLPGTNALTAVKSFITLAIGLSEICM